MTDLEIQQSHQKHAAMAQYYRWFQVYERGEGGLDNALDILSEDIQLSSGLGKASGLQAYAERFAQIPSSWGNAHHVNDIEITIQDDGGIQLDAQITYLNQGMLENGQVRSAELNYATILAPPPGPLPKFTSITITSSSDQVLDSYTDAYGDNRVKSLVHYWLALIENPSRETEPFREILTQDFVLAFSSGDIRDFAEFKTWLTGPASAVAASSHEIEDISITSTGDDAFEVSMNFNWQGLLPDGTKLAAKTQHHWTIENDIKERFARIKRVDVEILEPFAPVTATN